VADLAPFQPYGGVSSVEPRLLHQRLHLSCDDTSHKQQLVWRSIAASGVIKDQRPASLSGAKNKRYVDEFNGYIDQGNAYWTAARRTDGPARALLYYYAALQLAKAELLLAVPERVSGKIINHGLRIEELETTSLLKVRVGFKRHGVFPEIVSSRIGQTFDSGTTFNLLELMSSIPDSGWELRKFGRSRQLYAMGLRAWVVVDSRRSWTVLSFPETDDLQSRRTRRSAIEATGFRVRNFQGSSLHQPGWVFAESIGSLKRPRDGEISNSEIELTRQGLLSAIQPMLGVSPFGEQSQEISFLGDSQGNPVSSLLSRYCALFLLSSVIRYRPGLLASRESKWLADTFLDDSMSPLLQGASMYLTGDEVTFS
jgi:YaaC-like Protein